MTDQAGGGSEKAQSSMSSGSEHFYSLVDFNGARALFAKYRPLILRGAMAGLLLGLVWLAVARPVYTAKAQLLIDPALTGVIQEGSAMAAVMDSQKIQTEIAVLESEEVSLAAIKALKLAEEPEFHAWSIKSYLPDWLVSGGSTDQDEAVRQQALLTKFRRNLSVDRVGVSYAVEINYTAADAALAAKIANGIADAYAQFQITLRSEAARVGSEWLAGRVSEIRQAMNDASRKMQERRASQNYGIGPSGASRISGGPAGTAASETMSFEELESTALTYRRVYESFLGSYMSAVQRQSFPIAGTKIITRATPPVTPSRSAVLVLAVASVLGLAGGLLLGLARDRFPNARVWDHASNVSAQLMRGRGNLA